MKLVSPRHESDAHRVAYNLTLHKPTFIVGLLMDALRIEFKRIAQRICEDVPEGRERSMALTAIEDACMYAIAGIARAVDVED